MPKHHRSDEEDSDAGEDDGRSKRQRRTIKEDDDDDYDEPAVVDSPPAAVSTPRTSRTKTEDSSDEHMVETPPAQQGEDASKTKTPSKINAAGKPAEAGIVTKISVENFMCHRKLTIDLCHNVNFIHGQNGSGKSAILAALQICLGAGAKRTNRARNLKELVRKEGNANYAKVRVTLLNKGPDAFQSEVYGDYITIERSIALGGSYNGFKLYSADNEVKSTARKDLNNLLDQLNIQVENPVAVLDQEEAKKFLMGKPEDKYNFFTKATDLERLDRTYASTVDKLLEMAENKEKIQNSIKPLADNVKKLEKEWEQFQYLEKLEDKLGETRLKLAWSLYQMYKDQLAVEENKLARCDEAVAKRKSAVEKAEANQGNSEGRAELDQQLQKLTEEAEAAEKLRRELHTQLKEASLPKKQHERGIKNHRGEMSAAKRTLSSAVKALDSKRKEILNREGSAESEQAERVTRMKQAEDQIAESKRIMDENKPKTEESLKRYEQLQPRERALAESVNSIERQCYAVRDKINGLKSSEGNSINMFGPKCVAMSQKVEQAKRAGKFRGRVVGPIGKHLKVNPGKERFASMAELALGIGLDKWIVTNDHDRVVYMRLRREIGCSTRDCGVFQMTDSNRYNVTLPPSDDVETVSTVLNATDDLVFNCLVDNGRTDQKALMESKDSSEAILLQTGNDGKLRIKGGNIKTVFFLPDGDFWNLYGNSLSLTSQDKKMKQTIGIDRTVAIRESERELQQLDSERKQIAVDLKQAQQERHQHKYNWNQLKKSTKDEARNIEKYEKILDDIREETEEAENVVDDTSEFEDDVKNAQDAYDNLKAREEELVKKLEDFMPGIEALKNQLEEENARNEMLMKDLKAADEKLSIFLNGQEEERRNLIRKREKMEKVQQIRAEQEKLVEAKKRVVGEILHKAKRTTLQTKKLQESKRKAESGETHELEEEKDEAEELESIEPLEVGRDPTHYEERIRRDEKRIEQERQRRQLTESDPEVALQKFQRAKVDLDRKVFQIEKISENIDHMTDDLTNRKKKWKDFRSYISHMTNENFDGILNRKDSSGQIKFNHKSKALDLIVQKDNTNEHTQTTDVKALSGGERSYTTLALLLALGECLETPFRVMDEFDVFLDPVARRIALQTMIEVAKTFEHRQFIFITPQDLSNIKTDPKLKIFLMKPPKRSELVGGAEQQTLPFAD